MRSVDEGAAPGGAAERHFVFAPGGRRDGPVRYILSLAIFVGVTWTFLVYVGFALGFVARFVPSLEAALNSLSQNLLTAPWQLFLAIVAGSNAIYIIALAAALAIAHRRSLLTVLTDGARFDWLRMLRAAALYAVLLIVPFVIYLLTAPNPPELHFAPRSFAILTAMSFAMLLIQTSAEEILFRGYLVQLVGSFTKSLTWIVGIPAVLFAAAHLDNPEFMADPWTFTFYFGFGLCMSLIAIRDRSVELTIGAHLANNLIVAILVRTPDSIFQTPTLYLLRDSSSGPAIGPTIAPLLFFGLTWIFMRRRNLN